MLQLFSYGAQCTWLTKFKCSDGQSVLQQFRNLLCLGCEGDAKSRSTVKQLCFVLDELRLVEHREEDERSRTRLLLTEKAQHFAMLLVRSMDVEGLAQLMKANVPRLETANPFGVMTEAIKLVPFGEGEEEVFIRILDIVRELWDVPWSATGDECVLAASLSRIHLVEYVVERGGVWNADVCKFVIVASVKPIVSYKSYIDRKIEEDVTCAAFASSRIRTSAEKKKVRRGVSAELLSRKKGRPDARDLIAILLQLKKPLHAILFMERGFVEARPTAKMMRTALRVAEDKIAWGGTDAQLLPFYEYALRHGAPCSQRLCLRAAAMGPKSGFLLTACETGADAGCDDERVILRFLEVPAMNEAQNMRRVATVRALCGACPRALSAVLDSIVTLAIYPAPDIQLAYVAAKAALTKERLCTRLKAAPSSPLILRCYASIPEDHDDHRQPRDFSSFTTTKESIVLEATKIADERVEHTVAPLIHAVRAIEDAWIAYSYFPLRGRPGYDRAIGSLRGACSVSCVI